MSLEGDPITSAKRARELAGAIDADLSGNGDGRDEDVPLGESGVLAAASVAGPES
jgi:hypothetical protein